ncbi:MAG: CPBP family glutamic-type intramembrane protease [Pseudomonadota bacterium]
MNKRVIGIVLFFALAAGSQYLFRHGGWNFYERLDVSFPVIFLIAVFCLGGSVTLAAMISWVAVGRQGRKSSLTGRMPRTAPLMMLVLPVVVGAFGYANDFGMNKHLAGVVMGGLIALYALFEEIAWRGYLNDALADWTLPIRSIVIGAMWFVWHFWFLDDGATLREMLILAGILVALSALFITIVEETRSWLSVAAFHAVGNIAFFAGSFSVPDKTRWMMAGTAFVILLVMHHTWKRRIAA